MGDRSRGSPTDGTNNRSSYHASTETVQRSTVKSSSQDNPPSTDESANHSPQANESSLMDKFRDHYNSRPKGAKAKRFSWFLFHSHAIGQLYMMLNYFIPTLLEDWGPNTQYVFKILACYCMVMSEANWWCTVLYSSDLPDIRDRPTLDENDWFQRPPDSMKNAADVIPPKTDRYGFQWKYCKTCDRYKPPRSHHCDICNKCILRRDHHCYFVGYCIGHYNQRYFIVMCFWGILTSLISLPVTVVYMNTLPDPTTWADYFLPYTIFQFLYHGAVSWQLPVLVFQCYTAIFMLLAGLFYFTVEISLVSEGKTLVELAKKFDMKVTSDLRSCITMVFGDYWAVNLLFPAQLIFKQRHDGIHYENVKFFGQKEGTE